LIEGEVGRIDTQSQKIIINQKEKQIELNYDRLVIAAGSQLLLPEITGLKEHAFTVDTIKDAIHLDKHINGLPDLPEVEGKYTTIVVGAGFTGLEIATEMTSRLKEIAKKENKESEVKVILIDRNPNIGQDLGVHPGPIIEQALIDMDIEIHTNETVTSIDSKGVILDSGERLVALTTIWTGGVKASPLAADLPVEKDILGRLPVDSYLKVEGLPSVFAVGDTARAKTDDNHVALMTC
jgi:NADH dehydrogenase